MAEPEPLRLRLYVAGQSPKSSAALALANIKRICADHLVEKYEIEVIDLLLNPQVARSEEIIAVPTLVRLLPTQSLRVIGDLSDVPKVLAGLQLPTASLSA